MLYIWKELQELIFGNGECILYYTRRTDNFYGHMRVCESDELAYFDFIIHVWYYMTQFISKYNNF